MAMSTEGATVERSAVQQTAEPGEPAAPVEPTAAAAARPGPATVREDTVLVLLGACLVGGLLSDSWAHVHLSNTLEGFFTPWHGLLYAGFLGTAAWTFWLPYQRRAAAPRWWRDAWPAGYQLGAVGVLIFAAGGAGDMFWHEIFGVEVGVNAAFSPSHLLIGIGAVLVLSSPLRSWWVAGRASSDRRRVVLGVASLALAVTATTPLLNHSLALFTIGPTVLYDPAAVRGVAHYRAIATIDGYLVTTFMLTLPLLLVHRRRATPGTATALVGGVALFLTAMFGFPHPQTVAAVSALAGAVAVDACLARLDAVRGADAPLRLPLAGALFPTLVWSGHLLGLQLAAGLRWPTEMWTGTIVLTAVVGALLGTLAARPTSDLR